MNAAKHYRAQALKLDRRARDESNPALKAELTKLAASYRRLAEQADRNAALARPILDP